MKPVKDSQKRKSGKILNTDEMLQKLEDLELVNSVNVAVNRGESLEKIIKLISVKTKKLFSGSGIAVYLLSDDGKYLIMQGLNLSAAQRKKIEQLIKIKVPEVKIPIKELSCYFKILKEKKPVIINDAVEIEKLIMEFVGVLPKEKKLLKNTIIKFIPQIYKILNIKSIMVVPLISNGDVIGLMDISGRKPFTAFDLERINIISEQLVAAIKRKKIEDTLKDAYEELDQVFNVSVDAMRIISIDYIIMKINKAFTDLFGLSRDKIVGRKCFEVFYGSDCHTKNCILRRTIGGEKIIDAEVPRENIYGKKILCILNSSPIRNKKGEIIGIIECFKDITLQKKAFEEVKTNENRFKELFDNMSSGVAVYEAVDNGSDFIIRDFNKAAERIEKVKREAIIGKSVLKIFPGVKNFGIFDVFKRVYQTGKPEKYPIAFYKDSRISGWRRNYIYKLPSGEIVAVYDDLTRQKQAEESLRDSEKFSSSLMENSPNPILVIDADSSIKYVNSALESRVGLKSNEILGKKPPYPWWPEKLRRRYKKEFDNGLNESRSNLEYLFIDKMGEEFWVEVNSKLVFSNKKLTYRIITWFDVTDRKLMENDLKESYNKLQKTLQGTINALAAIVETRDPYTSGHQKRVTKLAVAISKELNLSQEMIECIETAAKIHDIGKINIPASILTKPGRLTDIEYNLIKTHPQVGYEMVKEIEFPTPVAEIILQHHEKLDGSGYPRGLKGKDIMLEAKILTVADIVEAMSSYRPYRPALGLKKAIDEIKENKGKLYDPGVVDTCVKIVIRQGFKFD